MFIFEKVSKILHMPCALVHSQKIASAYWKKMLKKMEKLKLIDTDLCLSPKPLFMGQGLSPILENKVIFFLNTHPHSPLLKKNNKQTKAAKTPRLPDRQNKAVRWMKERKGILEGISRLNVCACYICVCANGVHTHTHFFILAAKAQCIYICRVASDSLSKRQQVRPDFFTSALSSEGRRR